ncbi:MAG: PilZ domain-containing protein [Paludibaculum sp.]
METQEQSLPVISEEVSLEAGSLHSGQTPSTRIGFAIRRAKLGGKDARTEPRFSVREESASLWVLNHHPSQLRQARLLDISHSGLGILLEEEIPAGSWIRVEFGDIAVFGEVRYCRRQVGGDYRLGALTDWVIAKTDIARWGALRGQDSERQLCDAFTRMKSGAVRYGPPL